MLHEHFFNDILNESTILIKNFERKQCVERAINSIRFFYDDINILIVNDSSYNLSIPDPNVEVINTEFDIGLSAGRNIGIDNIKTPYFILLDDDHVLTEESDFTIWMKYLKENNFDIVGGKNYNYFDNIYQNICEWAMFLDWDENDLHAFNPGNFFNEINGVDMVANFFMAKTELIKNKNRWNNKYKIKGEHVDFFLRAKDQGLRIGYTPNVACDHVKTTEDNTRDYVSYRGRTNPDQDGRQLLLNDYDIENFYIGNKRIYFDEDGVIRIQELK